MPITPKPIYRQGSFVPTRGQNKPQGYIMRELAKRLKQNGVNKTGPFGGVSKYGSTGRSETRSGLAKRSLQRSQGQRKPQLPGRGRGDNDVSMAKSHLMKLLGL